MIRRIMQLSLIFSAHYHLEKWRNTWLLTSLVIIGLAISICHAQARCIIISVTNLAIVPILIGFKLTTENQLDYVVVTQTRQVRKANKDTSYWETLWNTSYFHRIIITPILLRNWINFCTKTKSRFSRGTVLVFDMRKKKDIFKYTIIAPILPSIIDYAPCITVCLGDTVVKL